ncbi:MAG: GGDEF domain-containing protein [Alphaproteobacteria bacterium]|nr:GGDEF domain-containing protein [Alphaproteobacteria bacterium]
MLDPATLVFTFFTAQCAGTIALIAVWFINRGVPGIGLWVLARVSLGLGLLLFLLRFDIPLVASTLISTTLILFGHILAIAGSRRFMDRPPIPWFWAAAFFALYWPLLGVLTISAPDEPYRHIVVSTALFVLSFVNVWSLWPRRSNLVQFSPRVMAGIYGVTGLFFLVRAGRYGAAALGLAPPPDPVGDIVLVMLEGTAASVLIASTYITMVTEHLQADLRQQAETDPLTGLLNRRAFDRQARRAMQAAERHGDPLFLLFLDLDHFKSINDRFGHSAGDRVIQGLAETILATVRETDLSARLGGEEFAILLSRAHAETAHSVAERIRRRIETLTFDGGAAGAFTATLSVGIAARDRGDTLDTLMHRADEALYRAKKQGRNQVVSSMAEPLRAVAAG